MPGPIKPSEVRVAKTTSIPNEVFDVVNRLLTESWNGHKAIVMQDRASEEIAAALDIPRAEVFARHLLDVEESYREQGWNVKYEKPAYCESYEASFTFTLGKY